MTNKIYSIFDRKARVAVNFFVSQNDAAAERSFVQLLANPQPSIFSLSPDDFDLYYVGDFDDAYQKTGDPKVVAYGNSYSIEKLRSIYAPFVKSDEGGVSRETD